MSKKATYRGELAHRNTDTPPDSPATTVLGPPSEQTKERYERSRQEWVARQVLREFEGIDLLLQHYEIKEPDPSIRFLRLSIALARNHVPYFMPPTRGRGRPAKTKAVLPLIDALVRKAPAMGVTQNQLYEGWADILCIEKDSLIREIKRFRRSMKDGKNKT